jgi:hypothetical protein
MRFGELLAVATLVGSVAVGASIARADGADPMVKITVPKDPTIAPCSDFSESGIECFTSNSESNPVDITGPTAAQLAQPGGFDILTNFIYEPTDCVNGVCPSSDTLDTLWVAINPTIPGASYNCSLGASFGVTPAFNQCPSSEGVSSDGLLLLELACVSTDSNSCTGMLPGQEGTAEVSPEPSEFLLLGVGVGLLGLYNWKSRNAIARGQLDRGKLAAC